MEDGLVTTLKSAQHYADNGYVVAVPLLARSGTFLSHACAYEDRVFGIEFHAEMIRQMIDLWCKSKTSSQKLSLTGAQAHDEQLADHDRFATVSLSWLDRLVDGIFLDGPTTYD